MAQDIYTKITELDALSSSNLRADDTFMVSRPTGVGANYVSYKCDYGEISSAFVSSVVNALSVSGVDISAQGVVQTKDDLQPEGVRLVTEKVVWAVAKEAGSIAGAQGVLRTKDPTLQAVEGPVIFRRGLSCNNDSVADSTVVNYKMLENYVATASMVPFMKGCTAEGDCTTVYWPEKTKKLYGIAHKISKDCVAQVILRSTSAYQKFCIFMCCMTCQTGDFDTIYNNIKNKIDSGSLNASDYCILQYAPLAANVPTVFNFPLASENIICFFPEGTYDAESGLIVPKAGSQIQPNKLTITVREYRKSGD